MFSYSMNKQKNSNKKRGIFMSSGKKIAHFSPGRVILTSMFFTIFAGTLLLALPIAQKTTTSFLDLLFTATSATCVTGLATVPLSNFTLFGHAIISVS